MYLYYKYDKEIRDEWKRNQYFYPLMYRVKGAEFTTKLFIASLSPNGKLGFKKYYNLTENGPVKHGGLQSTNPDIPSDLPELSIECAKATQSYSGLYFIGIIGQPPAGKPYYIVKIGQAMNIQARIKQYLSHNPMIYHDDISIQIENSIARNEAERTAQNWLKNFAYAYAMNTYEMFYVNEEDYFNICEFLKDKNNFKKIAGMA